MAQLTELEKSRVKLTIEIPWGVFAEAMQKSYIKNVKKFNIQGFRKGKAPRKVIESIYGESVFYEDAFDIVYPEAYESAVKELGIEPVDRPEIDIDKINSGDPVVFTSTVAVKPDVELGVYKGIELTKREYNVTDEQVDAEIEKEREKVARYTSVNGPAQSGDIVVLDYSGSVDGVKFEGGTARDQRLEIGSGMFIPGFEEQLIGTEPNEQKNIEVKFPEDYHSEQLAGKAAVFEVTVKSIEKKELPDADDEFAKEVSEFDTLGELKSDIRRQLEEKAEERIKYESEDEAVKAVVFNANVEIPDAMIEHQISAMLRDVSYRLSMQGLSLEEYLKHTGKTYESVRDEYREEAEKRVKTQLVLEAIAKEEKLEPDAEAVEQLIDKYARRIGQEPERFKESLNKDDREYFEEQNIIDQTMNILLSNAVYTHNDK
ncbi:MAG: Trigger factor [Firmicutes bacterium ADurb.Bin182]|nr:MAG: Trigger factor [Firmicutes bacterium ADurb.Bin182]